MIAALNPWPREPGPREPVGEQLAGIRAVLRVHATMLVWIMLQTGYPLAEGLVHGR